MAIKMTYVDFAQEVIALVETIRVKAPEMGLQNLLDEATAEGIIEKANDLIRVQNSKTEYNKKRSAKKAGNASSETIDACNRIAGILTETPKTGAEIAEELGEAWTALQISTFCKRLENVVKTKVTKEVTDSAGKTTFRQYTAYSKKLANS